jgi:predicted AAA+ superfamily ATPase
VRAVIERKEYLDLLIGYRDKRVIKIITGIRRCGKSALLALFRRHLTEQGVEAGNMISIDFEDYDNRALCEPGALEFEGNRKLILGYLQGVYDSVVLKDVVGRYKIPDVTMPESIMRFAFDNIANRLSAKISATP